MDQATFPLKADTNSLIASSLPRDWRPAIANHSLLDVSTCIRSRASWSLLTNSLGRLSLLALDGVSPLQAASSLPVQLELLLGSLIDSHRGETAGCHFYPAGEGAMTSPPVTLRQPFAAGCMNVRPEARPGR